ncbi:DUF4212 domain-containing protein [Burkholderiaceae bacterium UC74_6]
MPDEADLKKPQPDQRWRRTRRVTLVLLAVWAFAGFGLVYFARDLNRFEILGGPLGFWIASQGAVLVFLGVVIVFAVLTNRGQSGDGSGR